jgi:hypothetical protein
VGHGRLGGARSKAGEPDGGEPPGGTVAERERRDEAGGEAPGADDGRQAAATVDQAACRNGAPAPASRSTATAGTVAPSKPTTVFTTKSHGSVEVGLTSRVYGKEQAWADYCATFEGEPDLNAWNENIDIVSKEEKKGEGDFGEDQWRRVLTLATLPI